MSMFTSFCIYCYDILYISLLVLDNIDWMYVTATLMREDAK